MTSRMETTVFGIICLATGDTKHIDHLHILCPWLAKKIVPLASSTLQLTSLLWLVCLLAECLCYLQQVIASVAMFTMIGCMNTQSNMSFVIVVCAVIVLVTVSVSVEYELRTPQNYHVELLFLSLGITQSFLEVSIFSTFTSNILQLFCPLYYGSVYTQYFCFYSLLDHGSSSSCIAYFLLLGKSQEACTE